MLRRMATIQKKKSHTVLAAVTMSAPDAKVR